MGGLLVVVGEGSQGWGSLASTGPAVVRATGRRISAEAPQSRLARIRSLTRGYDFGRVVLETFGLRICSFLLCYPGICGFQEAAAHVLTQSIFIPRYSRHNTC